MPEIIFMSKEFTNFIINMLIITFAIMLLNWRIKKGEKNGCNNNRNETEPV